MDLAGQRAPEVVADWRGSVHMDLAGQRAPEVVADRGRRRWRRPGRSGALGLERERERGGHEGLGAVGCMGGSAGCGLGDVGETGGPLDPGASDGD